jgi:hypothetical protein
VNINSKFVLARIPVTFAECSFFLIDKNNFNLRKVVGGCGNLMQSGLFPKFLMLSASQHIFFFQETVKKCRKLPKVSGTCRKVTNSAGNCQFPPESNNFCHQKLFCWKLAKME